MEFEDQAFINQAPQIKKDYEQELVPFSEKICKSDLEEKIKQKRRTLEERVAFHKMKAKQLHQKIASRERKERTRRLIEIGAYVEAFLKTSTKEEAIEKIQEMYITYCVIKKLGKNLN